MICTVLYLLVAKVFQSSGIQITVEPAASNYLADPHLIDGI